MSAGESIIQFIKDLDPRADEAVAIRQMKAMHKATQNGESVNFAPLNLLRSVTRGGVLCLLADLGFEKLSGGSGLPLQEAFLLGTAMDMIQSTLRGAQASVREARKGGFKD